MKTLLKLFVVFSVALMVGCVQYTLVPIGKNEHNGMSVETSINWNKSPVTFGPKTVLWTADGEMLNRLVLVSAVADKEAMFHSRREDTPQPKFSANLLPHEIEAFIKTSMTNMSGGQYPVETSNLTPAKIGQDMGIKFDISYYNVDGLLSKGKVGAVITNGKLYAMIFTAASLHHYDKYKGEVDRILSTLSI